MKAIYIIEGDFVHRKHIGEKIKDVILKNDFELYLIESNQIFSFYKSLNKKKIQDEDIFIVGINLKMSITGIDIATKIRKNNNQCSIIFITNDSSKSIDIINTGIYPSGYLIKQRINFPEFNEQLTNIFNKIKRENNNYTSTDDFLLIQKNGENIVLKISDICYIETITSDRYSVRAHLCETSIMIPKNIGYLKQKISSPTFYTDLRSYIINTSMIKRINRVEECITFSNSKVLHIGKKPTQKLISYMRQQSV